TLSVNCGRPWSWSPEMWTTSVSGPEPTSVGVGVLLPPLLPLPPPLLAGGSDGGGGGGGAAVVPPSIGLEVSRAGSLVKKLLPDCVLGPDAISRGVRPKMLLPEIAALTVVVLFTPIGTWAVRSFRMVLLMTCRLELACTLPSSPKAMMVGFSLFGPCSITLLL